LIASVTTGLKPLHVSRLENALMAMAVSMSSGWPKWLPAVSLQEGRYRFAAVHCRFEHDPSWNRNGDLSVSSR
jgi:hypothetical protein